MSARSMVWLLLLCPFTATSGVRGQAPTFVESAGLAGLDFVHFNGMSGELYFAEMMGSGGALLDYDGDGDLDLYVSQGRMLGREKALAEAIFPAPPPEMLRDRLFRNDGASGADGSLEPFFVDATEESGIAASEYGVGAATADYDGDGWVDLYVTNFGPNQLWHNNGDGTFTDVTEPSGTGDRSWTAAASFFDYDRDGWLDLYVANYVEYRTTNHKPCTSSTGIEDYCSPLAYQREADRLFRNRGDGTFEDLSTRAGIAAIRGSGLGSVAADFDLDGWTDVYVTNDQMPNFLWMNQGDGTFRDNALLAGAAVNEMGEPEASMGIVAGDLNGDGSDDLFMTHLARETNTLYLNDGNGFFLDSTRTSGLGLPSFSLTGFGVALVDYDLDGWLDLYVANGAVTRIEELMRHGDEHPLRQPDLLFRNIGNGVFEDISATEPAISEPREVGRGVAVGDLDNDGDPDLVVFNNAGPLRLLLNGGAREAGWLRLIPLAPSGAVEPGVRVQLVDAEGRSLWRTSRTDGSFAVANDPRVLLGLGSLAGPLRLEVRPRRRAPLRLENVRRDRSYRFPGGQPGAGGAGAAP